MYTFSHVVYPVSFLRVMLTQLAKLSGAWMTETASSGLPWRTISGRLVVSINTYTSISNLTSNMASRALTSEC